jgi:hypothetical protein
MIQAFGGRLRIDEEMTGAPFPGGKAQGERDLRAALAGAGLSCPALSGRKTMHRATADLTLLPRNAA